MAKKNLKVFTLLFLLSVVVLALTGCSSNSEDNLLSSAANYDVNFEVTDKDTGSAVADAEIILAGESKFTDINGFVVPPFKKGDGKYEYTVKATGYDDSNGDAVVDGKDTTIDVKLKLSETGNSEPGDEDDTTAPVLTNLFAQVDNQIYGEMSPQLEEIILELIEKDVDKSYDYFILYFSEEVKVEGEFDLEKDFEIRPLNADSIEISNAALNFEFLMLKIDEGILTDYTGKVGVKINESGREKIFDLAGNMLESLPNYLEVEIN